MTPTPTQKDRLVRCLAVATARLDLEAEDTRAGRDPGPYPASSFYLAFGGDLAVYEDTVGTLSRLGWVERTATTLALTPAGRDRAAAVNARVTA